jgi:cation:H+ antiporter
VSTPAASAVFIIGAIVSLSTSWVLASRIERIGERLALSGALLGMVAAFAADTPEITSAITAMQQHEQTVGAGVVIGSNVFNLAALLGLGAIVAGRIALHRRVVILTGAVAMYVALICLGSVVGALLPATALALVLAVMLTYVLILILGEIEFRGVPLPESWRMWLSSAVAEEDEELGGAIQTRGEAHMDMLVAGVALVVVVGASVAMERAASTLGNRYGVPQIVIGGLVLAAVTSLPNVVAAVYLATHERGAAVLSTALNSNALNVLVGFLLPVTVLGISGSSSHGTFVTSWYVAVTAFCVFFAYVGRGLGRGTGLLIVASYCVFVGSLLWIA